MNEFPLRRDVLRTALAAGATSILAIDSADAQDRTPATLEVIDTNVSLFQWPFRRLPLDETAVLVSKLRELGVCQAWAGSFEGVLHRDISSVNERLAAACRPNAELRPVGTIHLGLPDWETDLRVCIDQHRMHAIRLYPNYHDYTLADARFRQLLLLASAAGVLVQIAVTLEDMRTQHPLVQAPDVDLRPLPMLMRDIPTAKVQLLNVRLSAEQLQELSQVVGLYFDTARTEGTDGVAKLIRKLPPQRVLFGSHAPMLIPEAALIRVAESQLQGDELQRLLSGNVHALFS